MIIHTVSFKLKHSAGSDEEQTFLEKGIALASIRTVENFRCLRQVSKKNPYDFNFSMEFADQAAYDTYNQHPDHQAFVQNVWLKEVEDFLEADFVEMSDSGAD
jgi:hypothetical protein